MAGCARATVWTCRGGPSRTGGEVERFDAFVGDQAPRVLEARLYVLALEPGIPREHRLHGVPRSEHPEDVLHGETASADDRLAAEDLRVACDPVEEGRLRHRRPPDVDIALQGAPPRCVARADRVYRPASPRYAAGVPSRRDDARGFCGWPRVAFPAPLVQHCSTRRDGWRKWWRRGESNSGLWALDWSLGEDISGRRGYSRRPMRAHR